MLSRTGAQRWPMVTAVPLSVREVPRRHSPLKHKGSTSSGPTNSATLTTSATMASLPGLRSTQATSRPLNNRIRLAMPQRRERASAAPRTNRPSCRAPVLMSRSLPSLVDRLRPHWVHRREPRDARLYNASDSVARQAVLVRQAVSRASRPAPL